MKSQLNVPPIRPSARIDVIQESHGGDDGYRQEKPGNGCGRAAITKEPTKRSAELQEIFLTGSTSEWRKRLDACGIPNAPLHKVSAVMSDEQTAALGILEVVPNTNITAVGLPIRFDGMRSRVRGRAPRLGEHLQAPVCPSEP